MATDPRPQLTHCALVVEDLALMEAFYTTVMGFTVTDRGTAMRSGGQMVFMSNSPDEHHQFVLADGRPKDVNFRLIGQLSFLVESLDEVRAIHDRVMARDDGEMLRTTTHGNAWSIYFPDPEGNTIEVYTHTPWYIPQPHAVPFDITLSNAEIHRFTEEHCREDPGFKSAGERQAEMREMMGLTG
jgi:catechol 2,3-dioxygenase